MSKRNRTIDTARSSLPTTGRTMQRAALIAFAVLLACAPSVSAQTAPLPTQLASAKTVFISNNLDGRGAYSETNYNNEYAAVQSLNRFTIVTTPQQADLVVEFGAQDTSLTLHILDPKLNIILWSVSELVIPAARTSTALKNEQTVINHLAADLQAICAPAPSSTN